MIRGSERRSHHPFSSNKVRIPSLLYAAFTMENSQNWAAGRPTRKPSFGIREQSNSGAVNTSYNISCIKTEGRPCWGQGPEGNTIREALLGCSAAQNSQQLEESWVKHGFTCFFYFSHQFPLPWPYVPDLPELDRQHLQSLLHPVQTAQELVFARLFEYFFLHCRQISSKRELTGGTRTLDLSQFSLLSLLFILDASP